MLYFGSFNPIHRGHIAVAEYVVERGLCDELIMVISPQNPLKSSVDLAPEFERFTMAEIACAESPFAARIKPSVIEFVLPKPSYTINTLRHLSSEYSHAMEFSILMGGDLVEQLPLWRDYEEILERYPIYLYPRPNERVELFAERMHYLADAPQFEISSTDIRTRLMRGEGVEELISPAVLKHIEENGIWKKGSYEGWIASKIESDPQNKMLYIERGEWLYKNERWGDALNDFNRAIAIDPNCCEAHERAQMVRQILNFRYKDIYNP